MDTVIVPLQILLTHQIGAWRALVDPGRRSRRAVADIHGIAVPMVGLLHSVDVT